MSMLQVLYRIIFELCLLYSFIYIYIYCLFCLLCQHCFCLLCRIFWPFRMVLAFFTLWSIRIVRGLIYEHSWLFLFVCFMAYHAFSSLCLHSGLFFFSTWWPMRIALSPLCVNHDYFLVYILWPFGIVFVFIYF